MKLNKIIEKMEKRWQLFQLPVMCYAWLCVNVLTFVLEVNMIFLFDIQSNYTIIKYLFIRPQV